MSETIREPLTEGERPSCYGFGETLFQVFTLMATMKSVLLRHYPALAGTRLGGVTNAFYP